MQNQESLDPRDWEEMRKLAHTMVDDAINYLQNIGEEKAWEPMPQKLKDSFSRPAPQLPEDPRKIYEEFKTDIWPYPMRTAHPRFWGWYMGNGSIMGSLADFLTSVLNSNAGGGNQVAMYLEDQVIHWMKEIMGYPEKSSGILVSGGSMANFVGLAVARHHSADFDIRNEGILAGGYQFAVYASTEVHSCNQKGVELLGLGAEYLRKIPVNDDYTIHLESLREAIEKDLKDDIIPMCVIASAGTVNTGAIDDLEAIADICQSFNVWFHVDGAIGAIAMLSDDIKPLMKGIERSDSVAMDLHKWMHIPFEAGCTLIRDKDLHHDTFSLIPEYLAKNKRGLASGNNWYSEYGLQLSRRARSIKVWMSIKEHGILKFGRLISRNVEQANYLGQLIIENENLELMAPIGMDIVCFRFVIPEKTQTELNKLNKLILTELHERGIAVPSYTTLKGNYCLRVAIANYRSKRADFDLLIKKVLSLGQELLEKSVTVEL